MRGIKRKYKHKLGQIHIGEDVEHRRRRREEGKDARAKRRNGKELGCDVVDLLRILGFWASVFGLPRHDSGEKDIHIFPVPLTVSLSPCGFIYVPVTRVRNVFVVERI